MGFKPRKTAEKLVADRITKSMRAAGGKVTRRKLKRGDTLNFFAHTNKSPKLVTQKEREIAKRIGVTMGK